MEDKIKTIIKNLVEKKHVYLLSSGSAALKHITNLLKFKTFLIQDQCWLPEYRDVNTYHEVKTNHGIIDLKDLEVKCQNKILIVNSLSNFVAEQPMEEIMEICKRKNCFAINDVSGSIGLSSARYGDYAACDFGKTGIINLSYGGFLASNTDLNVKEDFNKNKLNELHEKLTDIEDRMKYLYWINEKVKKDLNMFEILHKDKKGINILLRFDSEGEKDKIIKYCEKNQLEYELKPKYIKMHDNIIVVETNKK